MTTVTELEVIVGADTSDFEKKITGADKSVSGFADTVNKQSKNIVKGLAAISGVMIGIGAFSINAAADFESSFAEVRKTVDASEEQFSMLEDTIRRMATSSDNPLSALDNAHETLTGIAAAAGSLGIAVDDIDEFTQVIGAMTVATDLSADAAANFAARFANVTRMDMKNLPNLGNTIVELGNKMAATESEIAAFANRLSALATFDFDPDEILGYSAAMASLGLSVELGSTNMNKTMSDLVSAVATGGPKLKAFAEVAGMTSNEFKKLAQTDTPTAFLTFLEGLGKLDVSEQIAQLNKMGITSSEQQTTLIKMAAGIDTVKYALDTSKSAWTSSNALMEEASKKADTMAGRAERLQNKLNDMGISIGQRMVPGLERATTHLGKFLDELSTGNVGDALREAPGILDGIAESIAGAFGLGEEWRQFVAGIEAGGVALQIIFDRIMRGLQMFADSTTISIMEFVADLRQRILDATGGSVDIAPNINVGLDNLKVRQLDYKFLDSLTSALYADLNDGSIDLSGTTLNIFGVEDSIANALSLVNMSDSTLQGIADNMGFEAKRALEMAINTAFAAGNMEQVELLLPLAVKAKLNVGDMQASILSQIQAGLNTVAGSGTSGMLNAPGALAGAFTADLGEVPVVATPAFDETGAATWNTVMQGQIQGAVDATVFDVNTAMNVIPTIDPAVEDAVKGLIEARGYNATIKVDITAVPGSVDTTLLTTGLAGVGAGGGSTPPAGGAVGSNSHHHGGTFTPVGGGTEGWAWLKRGETVRTHAQENALNGGSSGNTFVIYGNTPYEVADLVDRANRERGY